MKKQKCVKNENKEHYTIHAKGEDGRIIKSFEEIISIYEKATSQPKQIRMTVKTFKSPVRLYQVGLYPYSKTFCREFSSYAKAREYMTHQLTPSIDYSYILQYHHKILGDVEECFVKHNKYRVCFTSSKESVKVSRMKYWAYGKRDI